MRTEVFTFGSATTLYRIRLAVPVGDAPPAGWPAVIFLGHDAFDVACALVRYHADCRAPGYLDAGVLIGVDDAGVQQRQFDYTPALVQADNAAYTGGADAFLHFLLRELRPHLCARLPLDPTRQTLAGHSLGGLFTLHTLLTQADAFQIYIASSPSVWWGGRYLEQRAHAWVDAKTRTPANIAVLISVGEYEQTISPLEHTRSDAQQLAAVRTQRAMVDGNRHLARMLATHPDLNVRFHVYPGQYHRSVWASALNLGLLTAFGKPV